VPLYALQYKYENREQQFEQRLLVPLRAIQLDCAVHPSREHIGRLHSIVKFTHFVTSSLVYLIMLNLYGNELSLQLVSIHFTCCNFNVHTTVTKMSKPTVLYSVLSRQGDKGFSRSLSWSAEIILCLCPYAAPVDIRSDLFQRLNLNFYLASTYTHSRIQNPSELLWGYLFLLRACLYLHLHIANWLVTH
jgi:hypothetical protein